MVTVGLVREFTAELAVTRHAGSVAIVQTVTGPAIVQTGKELGSLATLIGTGGIPAHGQDAAAALAAGLADPAEPPSLKPKNPALLVDSGYVPFACGLLAEKEPDAALTLGSAHMHPVGERPRERNTNGRTA